MPKPSESIEMQEWAAGLRRAAYQLEHDDRTLAQGVLGWIWARHSRTVPIPGFKIAMQVRENAAAMAKGPLDPAEMSDIAEVLERMKTAEAT